MCAVSPRARYTDGARFFEGYETALVIDSEALVIQPHTRLGKLFADHDAMRVPQLVLCSQMGVILKICIPAGNCKITFLN